MHSKNELPDRRRHKRKQTINRIEYAIEPVTTDETFYGVVVNMSETGLCILTSDPLSEGQHIRITDNGKAINQAAVVRWTEKYSDLYYKIGLELL